MYQLLIADSTCSFLSPSSVTSQWLEIGHVERFYTTDISKCWKVGPFFFLPGELVVKHLPAHHWLLGLCVNGGSCPSTRKWKIILNVLPGQPCPCTRDKFASNFCAQSGRRVCYLLRRRRDIKKVIQVIEAGDRQMLSKSLCTRSLPKHAYSGKFHPLTHAQ